MNPFESIRKFIAGLTAGIATFLAGFFLGKEREKLKEAEHDVEELQRQAEIESRPPDSTDAVLDWMRGK